MVSVIIPVYNVEKYLPRCIDSILAQTYQDLEIILVDDGSPDGCGKICDEYAEKDNRVVVIHKENGGVSSARNVGIKKANGEYIAFIDSDDWVHREYIACLVEGINEGADLAICSMLEVVENTIDDFFLQEKQYVSLSQDECLQRMLYVEKIGGFLCNKLFKKELITQMLDENIHYSEDFVFCAQYVTNIQQAIFLDAPLYYYWKNPNSETNKRREYNDKIFSLLEAEKILQKIYSAYVPETHEDISLNLLKVALNLRARYKYNQADNVKQYQELNETISNYYPQIMKSKKVSFKEKVNICVTRTFPVLLLKVKSTLYKRRFKR